MLLRRTLLCALVAWGVSALALPAGAFVGPIHGPRPVPPAGWTYLWIDPVYRTLTQQTWVPERTEFVAEWLETSPGHLERVYRQILIPGHYETTTRTVLLADGHWELVRVSPPPIYYPPYNPPVVVRSPATVGVNGYASGPVEDLSPFSPLAEWPK